MEVVQFSVGWLTREFKGGSFGRISAVRIFAEFFCKKMSNLAHNYANKNLREKTYVGDLSYSREFSFAGDIMEAVFQLISQEKVYEAVVGSGLAFSLKDWVMACFHRHSMDFENFIDYEFNENGHVLVSSPILMKSLGWTPHYDFEALVELMC